MKKNIIGFGLSCVIWSLAAMEEKTISQGSSYLLSEGLEKADSAPQEIVSLIANQVFDNQFMSFILHHTSVMVEARSLVYVAINGDKVLTVSNLDRVKIWDIQKNCDTTFNCPENNVDARFAGSEDKVLVEFDDEVQIYDLSGSCIMDFNNEDILSVFIDTKGERALTVGDGCKLKLWNISDKSCKTLDGWYFQDSVCFSPMESKIIGNTKLENFSVEARKVWDQSGTCLLTFKEARSVKFNSTEDMCVVTFYDGTVKIFKVNGEEVVSFGKDVLMAKFSPVKNLVMTKSKDGTVAIWDLLGRCTFTLKNKRVGFSPIFSKQGDKILIGLDYFTLGVFDLAGIFKGKFEHDTRIFSAFFLGDNIVVLTNKLVKIWKVNTGKALVDFPYDGNTNAFSFCKGKIATIKDGVARIWDSEYVLELINCLRTQLTYRQLLVVNLLYRTITEPVVEQSASNKVLESNVLVDFRDYQDWLKTSYDQLPNTVKAFFNPYILSKKRKAAEEAEGGSVKKKAKQEKK